MKIFFLALMIASSGTWAGERVVSEKAIGVGYASDDEMMVCGFGLFSDARDRALSEAIESSFAAASEACEEQNGVPGEVKKTSKDCDCFVAFGKKTWTCAVKIDLYCEEAE